MNITITLEQYKTLDNAIALLHDFISNQGAKAADYAIFDPANNILKDIDNAIDFEIEQAARSARTDAWIKQANQDMRDGKA